MGNEKARKKIKKFPGDIYEKRMYICTPSPALFCMLPHTKESLLPYCKEPHKALSHCIVIECFTRGECIKLLYKVV